MDACTEMPTVDAEGYLVEPEEWNEDVAQELARMLDIPLTEDHWAVLRFMRRYYEEHQITSDARHVIKHLDGLYPGRGRQRLFELFPYGYVAQACRIAGMKRPRAWSTG